jgi:Xaa-Pro aminopeptidase
MNTSGQHSVPNPKINPSRRRSTGLKADGTPDDNDRVEIGPTALAFEEWRALGLELPNIPRLREFRLGRLTAELQRRDLGGILLFDPLNIRYATDTSNMQVWVAHNPARACYVSADGYVILWDFHKCGHLSAHLPLVREVRHGAGFYYFEAGDHSERLAARFAGEVDAALREHAGGNRRLAVDKIEISGLRALEALGVDVVSGQSVTEHVRLVKGPDEIKALRCAIASCEIAIAEMRRVAEPGVSEAEVWSVLHRENIRRGGEWIETRILASGQRTNPWFQECGPRIIQDGDLIGFDTDLVGPYGMCADISRTWLCGDGRATAEQRRLYRHANDHVMANRALLGPGVGFREITEKGHRLPEEFRPQRYGCMMHGAGLCDEYPAIYYPEDFMDGAFDYTFEPGMVICVEAYTGSVGGREGVKLEDQVLITEDGIENLTRCPHDERLF